MSDQTIREQMIDMLTVAIWDAERQPGESGDGTDTREVAASLLESGWRPPARVIEDQAQLGKERLGTVILDAKDGVARRVKTGDGPAWIVVGGWAGGSRPVALPAIVLWEPEVTR